MPVEPVFDFSILAMLACPACHGDLRAQEGRLVCASCHRIYSIVEGIPVLIADRAELSADMR